MSALHQRVRRTIRRHGLCPPGSRVLVALSGGSDSVALTLLLRDLAEHGGFILAAAAHLNHQLRPTAARDRAFCEAFAAGLGLPIVCGTEDVQRYARDRGLSIENGARELRYAFLERTADALGADRIAVGQSEDDQAETFLMKAARGAGAAGLGGVYPQRGRVVRPLLEVSRQALRDFLTAQGQPWMEDETNADLANPRNRMRHVVIPELERAVGGAARPSLARAARLVREDAAVLDELADARYAEIAMAVPDGVELDGARLIAEPPALRRRILLRALRGAGAGREVGLEHVEAAGEVLSGAAAAADLPGCRAELRAGKLVLRSDTL